LASEQTVCMGCGATLAAEAKFCSSCGSSRYTASRDVSGESPHISEPEGTFVSGFWDGLAGKARDHSRRPSNVSGDALGSLRRLPKNSSEEEYNDSSNVNRYPELSGLMLLSIPISCLIAYLIFRYQSYTWINAIGLLIVPFSIFCWIFTTIRAIHLVDVRFWLIPSTYVALVGGVVALLICLTMGLFSAEASRQGHQIKDTTLYAAAAILYCGCVVWSYFYNWRKTGSAILAISLTILQTLSASFVIGIFNLWIDGRNTKRYAREHGIG
jgi:hypothetical protein